MPRTIFIGSEPGEATLLCVALHGFQCSVDGVHPWCAPVAAALPGVRFMIPQADELPISAEGGTRHAAWYDYLTDHQGEREDEISAQSLRTARRRLQTMAAHELARCALQAQESLIWVGLSQGGCMALDLAAHDHCRAVLTLVAHPTYVTKHRGIRVPWFALMADDDSVFPRSWVDALVERATSLERCDGDHWIPDQTASDFVRRHIAKLRGATSEQK